MSLKFYTSLLQSTLTDGIHGYGAVCGVTEGPGSSQVLCTYSEDVGESLHQPRDLHIKGVDEGPVHSGPVFAVHLLPLNPVAQNWATVILWLMPGDVGGA